MRNPNSKETKSVSNVGLRDTLQGDVQLSVGASSSKSAKSSTNNSGKFRKPSVCQTSNRTSRNRGTKLERVDPGQGTAQSGIFDSGVKCIDKIADVKVDAASRPEVSCSC